MACDGNVIKSLFLTSLLTKYEHVRNDDREVQQVLDWMHAQPTPGARVYIFMVEGMHMFVQGLPVNHAMNPVEMKLTPEWDKDQLSHGPDRVV